MPGRVKPFGLIFIYEDRKSPLKIKTDTMKQAILLSIGIGLNFMGFAQRTAGPYITPAVVNGKSLFGHNVTARSTGVGSIDTLYNVSGADTPLIYYAGAAGSDSGYISGMDVYGDMGYAERYDFGSADTTLQVMGVVTLFGGAVNPASTKTVTFYTWNVGPEVAVTSDVYESGYPATALDSVTVPLTRLGIATVDTLPDTFKVFMFTTPTAYLYSSFFVGYTMNYNFSSLAGDTIALFTSMDGARTSPIYTAYGADTIINNQNVTMYSDGSWNDNATSNFGLQNDFYIFPIVEVGSGTLGAANVTGNKFSLLGNTPNPAVNSTNINFSLASGTDVTIYVTDMNGKILNTISQPGLAPGMHSVPVETSNMAAGNYLYIIQPSGGGGLAGKFTVAH
jgi:hypothetical protein